MQVTSTEHHTIAECGCCEKLLAVKETRGAGLTAIRTKLDRHLAWKPKCRRWYAALPTWEEMRGAFPDLTGNLSSEAYVRIMRDGGDPWSEENQNPSLGLREE